MEHYQAFKVFNMKVAICFLVFSIVNYCYGYNILVMMPYPFFSHTKSYLPLFIELAKRGHNVTMVSPYPLKETVPNFNEIVLDNSWEKLGFEGVDPRSMDDEEGILFRLFGIEPFCQVLLDGTLETEGLKEFLNDKDSKFDMVITETFFCQEPFIAVGYKYGAIQVSVQTVNLFMSLAQVTGNPHNPAYVPSFLYPTSDHMNFWQRSKNTLKNLIDYIGSRATWIHFDRYMRKHFTTYSGFESLPPIEDMFRNVSLVLVDNHMATSYPRPYLQNIVEIGGMTVKDGAKLDEEWEKYLNESVDGVIYFSWGSVYQIKFMRPHEMAAFMSAFGKLKQRVIMKVDDESQVLPGKPDNVKVAKWLPQASILAHPNIRAFISHGGLHGLLEGTYHGVPIIGTPLFADQQGNIDFCEEAGYCIEVNLDAITEENLLNAINRILTIPFYKENAVKRSKIMRDKPLSVMDNAIYWVEYVLRHKGAPHLRSAAADLYWYQYLLLDVIIVWGVVFLGALLLVRKTIRCVCKARKSKGKSKSKNKKE